MTEKQRNFILYLDGECLKRGINLRASDDELLGDDWFKFYKNFTNEYTTEVIDKLKVALGMQITEKRGQKDGKKN